MVEQRGMWAMIGTCIALGLWTTGLLWMTVRSEKRRLVMSGESSEVKGAVLEPTNTERLDEKV
jgi:ACS family pantothenate transporter-like MFS transporter